MVHHKSKNDGQGKSFLAGKIEPASIIEGRNHRYSLNVCNLKTCSKNDLEILLCDLLSKTLKFPVGLNNCTTPIKATIKTKQTIRLRD